MNELNPARLFEENYETLCRYLLRFTGDVDAAADAAQEAFLRLLDVNGELDNARAWLFTVATNLALDAIRTRQRRWKLLAAGAARAPHGDPTPTPDVGLEAQRQRVRVHAALQTLSEKERQVLLMREEGFAQREIAAAIGTTTKSVGTLIARALRKLARTLDSDREEL